MLSCCYRRIFSREAKIFSSKAIKRQAMKKRDKNVDKQLFFAYLSSKFEIRLHCPLIYLCKYGGTDTRGLERHPLVSFSLVLLSPDFGLFEF